MKLRRTKKSVAIFGPPCRLQPNPWTWHMVSTVTKSRLAKPADKTYSRGTYQGTLP